MDFPRIRLSGKFFGPLGISSACEETDNATTEYGARLVRLTDFFLHDIDQIPRTAC